MSILSRACGIAKAELLHGLPARLLLCLVLTVLTPVFFGAAALDSLAVAAPFECFLSLLGVVLITPLFLPEQPDGIRQTVEARATGPTAVYLVRIGLGLLSLLFFLAAFSLFLGMNESDVRLYHLLGTYANGVFLGGLGLASLALFQVAAVAYMVPLAYFCLNFTMKTGLGPFFLFSMAMEGDTSLLSPKKLLLFLTGIALIVFALCYREMTRRK